MPRTDIGRVLFWMSGTLLAFSVLALAIRGLSDVLSAFEILAIRSISGLAFLSAVALLRPELRAQLRPRRMAWHGLRNVIHFASQVAWVKAVILLPLATVFALEFTAPLWVAVLAVFLLGERLTVSRVGSVLLGFAGILFIVRPGMESFQPASLLVLAAAVGFGAVSILTKRLTGTETTFAILFWMNAMQLPLNLAGSDPLFITRLGAEHVLPALAVAVAGLASHYCLTNAFRSGDAIVVIPLDFLRIPLIAVAGWLVYGERLDPFVFLGAGVIIAGILWNLRAESAQRPQAHGAGAPAR